jgi:hypothetical protein
MHVQRLAAPDATHPLTVDLRAGYYGRDFVRGTLEDAPAYRLGALTGARYRFIGESLARARDTAAARGAITGFGVPEYSSATPWGVPAFFMGAGGSGGIAWNAYRDLRGQLDAAWGAGRDLDVYVGAEVSRQRVETFERVLAYLPVQDSVPSAAAAAFAPLAAAAYAEAQWRVEDLAMTLGVRYDRFDARRDLPGESTGARHSLNPRFAVSTALSGATVVASWGRFSQAPDYQYLVDAAFDDTTRTGRFRRGNPDLGFEQATQYELSVRARPLPGMALRVNAFVKRLDGLVASVPLGVDPDSSVFGNADFGTVRGVELLLEREVRGGWGARVAYTFLTATATATNPFQLFRRIRVDPGGDTLVPARVEYPLDYDRRHGVVVILRGRAAALGGLEAALVGRYSSGLPHSRTNATGDTLLGLPNGERLPSQATVDALVRWPLRIRGRRGSIYVDVRNLLNRRNVVAVRRDTGEPGLGEAALAAEARAAYLARPQAIPFESPRYRTWADLDGNGLVEGEAELYPLFLAAARDYFQALFSYGAPRLVRVGVEIEL